MDRKKLLVTVLVIVVAVSAILVGAMLWQGRKDAQEQATFLDSLESTSRLQQERLRQGQQQQSGRPATPAQNPNAP